MTPQKKSDGKETTYGLGWEIGNGFCLQPGAPAREDLGISAERSFRRILEFRVEIIHNPRRH